MTTKVFLTAGTSWTVPSSVTTLTSVEALGGGGGGAGANLFGGGGGSYSKITSYGVTAGNSISTAIGAGGSGGATNGTDGSVTTFNSTTLVAQPGKGGTASKGLGGLASAGAGSVKNNGGDGGLLVSSSTSTPSRVQSANGTDNGFTNVTSATATFASTVTNGSTVMGIVTFDNTGGKTITNVTDDKSNTYSIVTTQNDVGNAQAVSTFYRANITNAPQTISVNFSTSVGFSHVAVDEFSGLATSPLDQSASTLNSSGSTSANAMSSGNITPTSNGCLIWASIAGTNISSNYTAGTGFTLANNGGPNNSLGTEFQVQTSAATIAGTFTAGTGGIESVHVISFKAAGSATQTVAIPASIQSFYGSTSATWSFVGETARAVAYYDTSGISDVTKAKNICRYFLANVENMMDTLDGIMTYPLAWSDFLNMQPTNENSDGKKLVFVYKESAGTTTANTFVHWLNSFGIMVRMPNGCYNQVEMLGLMFHEMTEICSFNRGYFISDDVSWGEAIAMAMSTDYIGINQTTGVSYTWYTSGTPNNFKFVGDWLDNTPTSHGSFRSDWITNNLPSDGSISPVEDYYISLGGCVIFWFYMRYVKGFSWQQIYSQVTGDTSPTQIYQNLVGSAFNYTTYRAAVDAQWGVGTTAIGVATENIWHTYSGGLSNFSDTAAVTSLSGGGSGGGGAGSPTGPGGRGGSSTGLGGGGGGAGGGLHFAQGGWGCVSSTEGGNGGKSNTLTAGGAGSTINGTPGGSGANGSGAGGGFGDNTNRTAGGAGGNGIDFDVTHGAGGGGGGAGAGSTASISGGAGGLYGAGGGGGGNTGGNGAQGLLVITYDLGASGQTFAYEISDGTNTFSSPDLSVPSAPTRTDWTFTTGPTVSQNAYVAIKNSSSLQSQILNIQQIEVNTGNKPANYYNDTPGSNPEGATGAVIITNAGVVANTAPTFLRHHTGILIPESTKLASSHSKSDLWEKYCPFPVATSTYVGGILDAQFTSAVTATISSAVSPGRGGVGAPAASTYLDSWSDQQNDPGTFTAWTSNVQTGRYFRAMIKFDNTVTPIGYVSALTLNLSSETKTIYVNQFAVGANGTTLNFANTFHSAPNIQITPSSAGVTSAGATNITSSSATIELFSGSTQVAGTCSITLTGG